MKYKFIYFSPWLLQSLVIEPYRALIEPLMAPHLDLFRSPWRRWPEPRILERMASAMWEFPKIRDTLFWGPYNKDPTI